MIKIEAALELLSKVKTIVNVEKNDAQKVERILCEIKSFFNAEYVIYYHLTKYNLLENLFSVGAYENILKQFSFKTSQGVVGYVARSKETLQLDEIGKHPKYIKLPFKDSIDKMSFTGIPIIIGGKTIAVLVVKSLKLIKLDKESQSIVESAALILGELVREIVKSRKKRENIDLEKPYMSYGNIMNQGLAMGKAIVHEVFRPDKFEKNTNVEKEIELFHNKINELQHNLELLNPNVVKEISSSSENYEIIETYKMLTKDRTWIDSIEHEIKSGYNLISAVIKAQKKIEAQFYEVEDAKIRERICDLEDLNNKLISCINRSGEGCRKRKNIDYNNKVLFARRIGPAELLEYTSKGIKGIVFEETLYNSHVSIIAKSLNIPVVSGITNITKYVKNDDMVILDGDTGSLFIRPNDFVCEEFIKRIKRKEVINTKSICAANREDSCNDTYVTKDGYEIELYLNAGLQRDLEHINETKGVGLFRTEISFMMRSQYPDEETQRTLYERIYNLAGNKPVNFRTLDIGGDKRLPYFQHSDEENPIMGWRAIRMSLDRPTILRQQMRALLLASQNRDLRIILPMITQVDEFIRAKDILEREIDNIQFKGIDLPSDIQLGSMIEIPAIVWQLPELLKYVDFISVGSNDLFQFFFATDRENSMMSKRYDPLSTSFIRMLKNIIDRCNESKTPLFFCGEMARYPLQALVLMGLGVRKLSTNQVGVRELKRTIESTNLKELKEFTKTLVENSFLNIRNEVISFANENNIVI